MSYKKIELTSEELKKVIEYNPYLGSFYRLPSHVQICNRPNDTGYIKISVKGRRYMAHRLAWLYMYGCEHVAQIDHIDGDRTNNAIGNLRSVTNRDNCINKKVHREGKLPGTSFSHGAWFARIYYGGKTIHIGKFASSSEAHEAYLRAKDRLCEPAVPATSEKPEEGKR